jgi:hypothetical protein
LAAKRVLLLRMKSRDTSTGDGKSEGSGDFSFRLAGRGYFLYEAGRKKLKILGDPHQRDGETVWWVFLQDEDLRTWEVDGGEKQPVTEEERREIRRKVRNSPNDLKLDYKLIE